MSTFTAQHRGLVKDTNAGNILPPESRSAAGLGATPQIGTRTQIGGGMESDTSYALSKMLEYSKPTIDSMVKREQEAAIAEGYNTPDAEAAYQELSKKSNPFSKFLFGDGPTMRGIQQKIIENTSKEALMNNTANMKADAGKYDREGYKEMLNKQLQEQLDKYKGDPEIRKQLINTHAENASRLSWKFEVEREAYVQGEAAEALKDGIRVASKIYNADPDIGLEEIRKSIQPVEGQSPEAWALNTSQLIAEELAVGRDGAYKALMESPELLAKLDSDQRKLINDAVEVNEYQKSDTALAYRMGLEDSINNGDIKGTEQYVNQINELRPGTLVMNDERMKAYRQRERLAEMKRAEHAKKQKALAGKGADAATTDLLFKDAASKTDFNRMLSSYNLVRSMLHSMKRLSCNPSVTGRLCNG